MLAHRAMAQGEMVAEIAAGLPRAWDKRCIPAICFTDPEIVSAGLSPDEAREALQAVGQGVSELSAAFGLAIEMGAVLQDIAGTIHAHPTLGEAIQEAAFKALGHAIHV
jgi:dihydrolipoamide dehydrogenase